MLNKMAGEEGKNVLLQCPENVDQGKGWAE